MAGYTSKILFTLTVPSIFGFLSVLWFLKKKNSSKQINKAIQVEGSLIPDKEQYLVFDPMKLKNEVGNPSAEQVSTSEMQLKETQATSGKASQHCNGVSHQNTKVKGKKKGKSKVHENGTTCVHKESISNGCGKDIKQSAEDNELANGVEALSLSKEAPAKDEASVHVSKCCTEMESSNGPADSLLNGTSNNADSESQFSTDVSPSEVTQEIICKTDIEKDESQESNEKTAKECCDTEVSQISNERNCITDNRQHGESDLTNGLPADAVQVDTTEPLTLPVDCPAPETQGDMLESPGAKYCDSVGSNDSGKGGSEFQFVLEPQQMCMVYEFEILQELCGLLIGRNGRHVNYIKEETNANILIKRHPYYTHKKVCCITGTEDEIHAALKLIRKRFPIEIYPTVTLSQINSLPFELQLPETLKLSLPEGVSFEAMLCATVNAGHFFLQQPTHPTFHSLPALTAQMTALYSQMETPTLTHLAKGYVCAASLTEGWFRAEVDEVFPDSDECRLKFLDYGGYTIVPRTSLRQIRYDFMNVPFQATECYLGSVTFPEGENGWSVEATAAFEELAQGQIVQGYIVGYAENRVPYVHLYKITGATSIFINRELVSRGLAAWVTAAH